MTRGLKLPWQIGREPRTYLPLDEARPRVASTTAAGGADLLAAIRGELDELVRPVNVWRLLPIEPGDPGTRTILGLTDGQPLIVLTELENAGSASASPERPTLGRAVVVLLTTALDLRWTDLPAKPLMVPLVQELVRQGVGRARGGTSAFAGARVSTPGQSIRLVPWSNAADTQPTEPIAIGEYGATAEAVRNAGVWNAVDAQGSPRGVVVVNADSRAGRVDPIDRGTLAALLTSSAGSPLTFFLPDGRRAGAEGSGAPRSILTSGVSGRPTGPILLAAACLLALFELGLARRFSHATTGPSAAT
ncbi:MAG: hypothetical protein ACT4PL_06530 [Phycisphaerales bacterium]